jgi:phosphoglycerate kinase
VTKGIAEVDVRGKRVLLREDLNVPLADGAVADDTRVDAAVPTIQNLSGRGARVIVMSHLGRPDGKVVDTLRMAPVAAALSKALGKPVKTATDCVGPQVQGAVDALADGDVLLLENLRFHPQEEANDPEFARQLASLGDLYVDDAFATAHRAHASNVGITQFLPSYMGPLLERELDVLDEVLERPRRPFVVVLGGAKVADKIAVIERLLQIADAILIGGGMGNTMLAVEGFDVGKSLRDADLGPAKKIGEEIDAKATRVEVLLPVDAVVAKELNPDAPSRFADVDEIAPDEMILDIGPTTAEQFTGVIEDAKTILWNGPMGVFEMDAFAAGTEAVGDAIAESGAMSVIGGGDTAAAAHKLGFADKMSYISTGGGATLEYLEGKELPGVAALRAAASA